MKNTRFEKWGLGYSGCDGGDIGSPENPSIWVCGIEWGGGHSPEGLESHMNEDSSHPPGGYEVWTDNLAYIFNWQVMKLLTAINGNNVSEYKKFAEHVQPFVLGRKGYFKMNLYPIGFKDTSQDRWHSRFAEITGFESKSDYLDWCSKCRFPQIRRWAEQLKPKLIICLGKTYLNEFKAAFHEVGAVLDHESIDERDIFWGFNTQGTLIVILPFMVNRNGLIKNTSIQKAGGRIAQIITNKTT